MAVAATRDSIRFPRSLSGRNFRRSIGRQQAGALLWLIGFALCSSAITSPSRAQNLPEGSVADGVVSARGQRAFSFQGTAGEDLHVVVRTESPDTALDVSIEPATQAFPGTSTRFPGGLKQVHTLEQTGLHRISVINPSGRDVRFELEVLRPASRAAREILYGQCPEGRIDRPGELRIYAFHGRTDEVVSVSIKRIGEGAGTVPRVFFYSPDARRRMMAPAPGRLTVSLDQEGPYRLAVDEVHGRASGYRLCLAQIRVRIHLSGKATESLKASYSRSSPKDFDFEVPSGEQWHLDIQGPSVETLLVLRPPEDQIQRIRLKPGSTGTTFESLGPGAYRLRLESPSDEPGESSLVWSRAGAPPEEPSRWRFASLLLTGGLLGALLVAFSRPLRNHLVFPGRDSLKCFTIGLGTSLLIALAGVPMLHLLGLGRLLDAIGQVGPLALGLVVGMAAPVLWLKFSLK